jgi:hypothetical protein
MLGAKRGPGGRRRRQRRRRRRRRRSEGEGGAPRRVSKTQGFRL